MHVARYNFSPVNVARTSKKVGQAWFKVWRNNKHHINDVINGMSQTAQSGSKCCTLDAEKNNFAF